MFRFQFGSILFAVISFMLIRITWSSVGNPTIQISFPDVGDFDFQNESLAIITNSNPVFQLLCIAPYPIEWIFHYGNEDDGTSESTKLVESRRLVTNFTNPSNYIYTSKLRLGYRGKLLSLANFTCRQVISSRWYQPPLETHVLMTDRDKKSQLILKITNEKLPHTQTTGNTEPRQNCSKAIATKYMNDIDLVPCWECKSPETGLELELDFQGCLTPSVCSSMHSRQNMGNQCLKLGGSTTATCKAEDVDYNPRIVLCKNFGPALAQFYFFGIFRGDDLDDESISAPPVYFNWAEVDPQQMLYVHPINRSVVYVDEEIEIVCEYSRYYFALGSWFGLWNEIEGISYVQEIDIKPCDFDAEKVNQDNCTNQDSWRGTYTSRLVTSFSKLAKHKVFCLGPVWNSSEWINASIEFNVENGETPKISSLEPEINDNFIVGQQHRKLICRYTGKPVPEVSWTTPNNQTQFSVHELDMYTSAITFYEIGYHTTGEYKCRVSSYLGKDSKTFHLNSYAVVESKLSVGVIVGISLLVLVLVVIAFIVFARMRQIIQAQQQALRILTEAEVEEFVNGNPSLLENVKTNYFDRSEVIDALPYDEKYEIPTEKLNLDYSDVLGAGQYGTVVKGKLTTDVSITPYYVNINHDVDENISTLDVIFVAVKITKGDLDVQNFKALLSEIKVMAYLGTHPNIVSLVGASTQNIRNREIYIAVEYCSNGSLDVFLKTNKEDFVIDKQSGNNANFGLPDLYKWTEEIANGLEYIHQRKIIHADLAIRNILITADYRAKIGDFGLSRQLVDSTSYTKTTKCALPWRNMAIESLRNLEFSVKSDIWSLGVTIWEIFTLGDIPYPGMSYTVEFGNLLEQGLRLYKPPLVANNMYDYMLMCWTNLPEDRPGASDVIAVCAKARETLHA